MFLSQKVSLILVAFHYKSDKVKTEKKLANISSCFFLMILQKRNIIEAVRCHDVSNISK